jgi:hypothetical protein
MSGEIVALMVWASMDVFTRDLDNHITVPTGLASSGFPVVKSSRFMGAAITQLGLGTPASSKKTSPHA